MQLDNYQKQAALSDISVGTDTPAFVLLGLFGETGSVLSEAKKQQRDRTDPPIYRELVLEEIGDLLWYVAVTANRNNVRLGQVAQKTLALRKKSASKPPSKLTFGDIQKEAKADTKGLSVYLEWRLIDLAIAAAEVLKVHRDFLLSKNESPEAIIDSLAALLSELLHVSVRAGVSLGQAAKNNLKKIKSRWPQNRSYEPNFDSKFPNYERLPSSLVVKIRQVSLENNAYFVYQSCNDVHIGDRLTDNISDPDYYRFHDVFHYAYAAVLGWSPVTRSLFKLKRKSRREIDEAEDGARAVLIEEGVSSFVFNEAKKSNFFDGVERGRLSFDLLKKIKGFVEGYEVHQAPFWAWEEAILQGFEAFRFLRQHKEGTLTMNGRRIQMGEFR